MLIADLNIDSFSSIIVDKRPMGEYWHYLWKEDGTHWAVQTQNRFTYRPALHNKDVTIGNYDGEVTGYIELCAYPYRKLNAAPPTHACDWGGGFCPADLPFHPPWQRNVDWLLSQSFLAHPPTSMIEDADCSQEPRKTGVIRKPSYSFSCSENNKGDDDE